MNLQQPNISKPIVVQITSGATSSSDVCFLDALKNVGGRFKNVGGRFKGLPEGFSANVPFFTYGQLLQSLLFNCYQIGLLIITVLSGSLNMIIKPLSITTYNMQGDGRTKTTFVIANTFQNIIDQIIKPIDFLLCAETKIQIGGIFKKNTTMEYAFYPTKSYELNDSENYDKEQKLPKFDRIKVIKSERIIRFINEKFY